jgi:aspartyl-tRNA synthetase
VPEFSELKRTHTCGELNKSDKGKSVCLNGWVNSYRNLGGLLFIDLRDRYGITQIVIDPENIDKNMADDAARSRSEFVIAAKGEVVLRPKGMINKKMETGEIEIKVNQFYILAESETPPFEIEDECNAKDQLRLEYRYLDLRRTPLQKNIKLRHEIALAVRNYLDSQDFYEIETPLLIRSTPEGARDYIVPSRVQHGKFYALPQSPQLLKQILMVSGFDKYFQIARCLRDEDLRSDRQPEHTQIDLEMSFATPDDVFTVIEGMVEDLFEKVLDVKVEFPFPRFTFEEVISRWGIDKPDLRFGMEIVDLTDEVTDCDFKLFAENVKKGGVVKGIVLKGGGSYSRKQIDELTERAKEFGAGGLAYILRTENEDKSPIVKFIGDSVKEKLISKANISKGDALFIISDKKLKTEQILGQLRLHLGKKHNLIDKDKWSMLWVTQFPLFDYNEEYNRFEAMHNIVSHPLEKDLNLIEEGFKSNLVGSDLKHPWRKAKANQYDLVINGWEIASGGQRINRPELQKQILNILGIDNERAEKMFGFLLKSFKYGAPPHAGIAAGLDRLVALMAGENSIREVIAFPKTANAVSLMDGAPSEIDKNQLDELGLILSEKDNTK